MKGGLVAVLLLACFLGAVVSQNCGCAPGLCCSKWGYCGTGPDYCTGSGSTTSSPGTSSSSTTGTSGSCNLAQIFSQADFNTLFPNANGGSGANPIFTYKNLIDAAAYYPTFGCTGDVKTRKTELAAFLAQTSQETSGWWSGQEYKWGYYFSSEVGCTNTGCPYCSPSSTYPCAGGKGYYGRGPLQLSWNYNYGQVSRAALGNDDLLNNPDLLLSNGVIAFRTSIWFWMTAQNPKPSCHNVMTGLWSPSGTDISLGRVAGFGMTTNIINGGLECNQATPQKVINRVGYFTRYMKYFYPNDSPGNNLYCDRMTKY